MTDTAQQEQQGGRKGAVESEEPTRAQQVAVRRVAEAKATVPELTVRTDVDVTEAFELAAGAGEGVTLDDLVVKASALALRALPRANGAYRDGRFERYSRVNVGLAVPAGQGHLALPTIFDADAKPLGQVASEARALTAQVRDGSITAADVAGGTFTVTTTGGHAVDALEPIIVAPQAAGLGVGAVREA
ncbi:MAG TPA: 2-oxo acid dehydrogenase subunit E2, partial [Solirubrobacteraceae bacterium]|nr:2-oxo acid dehydrogenase subunit E2 [Solirubrobacteraceae bacterium]